MKPGFWTSITNGAPTPWTFGGAPVQPAPGGYQSVGQHQTAEPGRIAFLLQHAVLSRPFLEEFLGCDQETAAALDHHRNIRDLAAFRRYAAKFVSEYEMFSSGNLADGQPYADTMARRTGFYHQPESHLFDLVPELYSLDYLLGWIGAAMMADTLKERFGER